MHSYHNDTPDSLRRFDEVRVGKVGVTCSGAMATVPEQFADQEQVFTGHDGLVGGGESKVIHAKDAALRIGSDGPPAGLEAVDAPHLGMAWEQERLRFLPAWQRVYLRPRSLVGSTGDNPMMKKMLTSMRTRYHNSTEMNDWIEL